jgi:thiosulfate/3-mercaptopyruvate sulfurtransferase
LKEENLLNKKNITMTSPLITPSALLTLYGAEELIILDASNSATSKERYAREHLEGALHIDLETEIANIEPDVSVGGRHPLPSLENFSNTLTRFSITPSSHIIIYDEESGGNAAARLWWMLVAVGHEKVQVVDGGYQAAKAVCFPLSSIVEQASSPVEVEQASSTVEVEQVSTTVHNQKYTCEKWLLPLVTMEDMNKIINNENYLVVDVRSKVRYDGITEPIDLIAGHIPGAVNSFYMDNIDSNGFFLPPEVLKEKYSKIMGNLKPENVIFHCGSGVTACHTLLAIASAGLEIPAIYMGSWSEWSRNNRPMVLR